MAINKITVFSYPKINLALDILGRDSKSGYHLIQTVFHQLHEPFDELIIEEDLSGAISTASDNPYLPLDDTNTVLKAAKLLQRAVSAEKGIKKGAKIFIKKRIPLMSGLGGGSSNAVAALEGLARLWNCHRFVIPDSIGGLDPPVKPEDDKEKQPLNCMDDTLLRIAQQIGMDCAFFFFGGTALGEHFGEQINTIPYPLDFLKFEIIETGVEISSHWAYSQIDLSHCGKNTAKTDNLLAAMKAQSAKSILQNLHNDFEEFIFAAHPKLAEIKREIEAQKPGGRVFLCGSGGALVRVSG